MTQDNKTIKYKREHDLRHESDHRGIKISAPYIGIGNYKLGLEFKYVITLRYGKRKVTTHFYSDYDNFYHTNQRGAGFYRNFLSKYVDKFIAESFLGMGSFDRYCDIVNCNRRSMNSLYGYTDCVKSYKKGLRLLGSKEVITEFYDKIINNNELKYAKSDKQD